MTAATPSSRRTEQCAAATPPVRQLAAHACLHLQVRAGTRIQLLQGRVRLVEPPRWLGETMVWPARALEPGGLHVLQQGGWLSLQALDAQPVRWLMHEPATPLAGLRRALRRLARWPVRAQQAPAR